MKNAPIALFVYNRLFHLQQTISSLLNNSLAKSSDIYIYSDGPKNKADELEIIKIRKWLSEISGFKSITIIHREENFGLAKSIIHGVSELVDKFSTVIVLEDDLVVSPHFLQFMNDGLALYEHDHSVASIHGYALPILKPLPEIFFLRGADCWGWATWKRAWNAFECDGNKLLNSLQKNKWVKKFDLNNTQPNTKMLKNQIAGINNSWAIRWHASAFINSMFTLYPGKSLVQNIGMDNSGTHCMTSSSFDVKMVSQPITVTRIPIEQDEFAFHAYAEYFKSIKPSGYKRFSGKIKRLLLLG